MDTSRPHLILGAGLIAFLKGKRTALKKEMRSRGAVLPEMPRATKAVPGADRAASNGVRPNANSCDLLNL
jgi:hypothetical protein